MKMNTCYEEHNSLVHKLSLDNKVSISEHLSLVRNSSSFNNKTCNHLPVISCNGSYLDDLSAKTDTIACQSNQQKLNHEVLAEKKAHLFPNVLINSPVEPCEIDSDEEDFKLSHRKNDSGNGSSVGSSSLHSQPLCLESNLSIELENDSNIKFCLQDMDILHSPSLTYNRSVAFSNQKVLDSSKNLSDTKFMDVPLNNVSTNTIEKTNLNTFAAKSKFEPHAVNDPLKPPPMTDLQPKTRLLAKPSKKSWQIFGKIAVSVSRDSQCTHNVNSETVAPSTTALILEHRPSYLPPKPAKEEQKHKELYAEIVESAKRKELRDYQLQKKKMKERKKLEDQLSNTVKQWKEEIIPNWQTCHKSKKVRDLWSQGIPPSVRGTVWKLAIGNELHISTELFNIYRTNAEERMRNHFINDPITHNNKHHSSESSVIVSKENTVALIILDVSRTFPSLGIFQKGGPYHESLKNLLAAYTCHRPDIGYAQGMSFLAAMLLLNMDLQDAFVAFANLLNRPCQMAFFTVNQPLMSAYFRAFDVVLADQIPRLHNHFKQECLSHDIYLLDWIFTLYSKSLPLDTACRVWDMFFRDGEEFLFKTALGVLLMHEDTLLEMEFFRLATYLTKLSNSLTADELFVFIDKINFPSQKYHSALCQLKELPILNIQPT